MFVVLGYNICLNGIGGGEEDGVIMLGSVCGKEMVFLGRSR